MTAFTDAECVLPIRHSIEVHFDTWANLIRDWVEGGTDVYVYFDNDMKVRAPYDTIALQERLSDLIAR